MNIRSNRFKILLSFFGAMLLLFSFGKITKLHAQCNRDIYCGCGTDYQEDGGCSCGNSCDTGCQFADASRCEDDGGGGPVDPSWSWRMKVFLIYDNNHNEVIDPIGPGGDLVMGTSTCTSPYIIRLPSTEQATLAQGRRNSSMETGYWNIYGAGRHPWLGPYALGDTCDEQGLPFSKINVPYSLRGDTHIFMINFPTTGAISNYDVLYTRFIPQNPAIPVDMCSLILPSEPIFIHTIWDDPGVYRPYTPSGPRQYNFRCIGLTTEYHNRRIITDVLMTDHRATCDISFPAASNPSTFTVGQTPVFTASATTSPDTLVSATVTGPGTITVSPSAAGAWPNPAQFTLSGIDDSDVGTYTLRVTGNTSGGNCVATHTFQINSIPNWFRVWNGDIVVGDSGSGNITSLIPTNFRGPVNTDHLILERDNNDIGNAIYSGILNTNGKDVSTLPNWSSQTSRVFDSTNYDFFANKVNFNDAQADIAGATVTGANLTGSSGQNIDGYYVYRKRANGGTGDLTINGPVNLGNRKVILFVEGNLTINGRIYETAGQGFFMAVVKGNVTVAGTLGDNLPFDIEGLIFSDGSFNTPLLSPHNGILRIKGSVAAMNGFNLQRKIVNPDFYPSEVFTYAPDLMLLYPEFLGVKPISWQEVAP